MSDEVILRIYEAKSRDVGRSIVRIPIRIMKRLGVEPGDYVEIIGRKTAYAQVWPAYPEDEDKDIIRMDGMIRQNAGVGIGDTVKVRKVALRPAQRVVLAPTEPVRVDSEYLKKQVLLGKPVTRGQAIDVPFYGGSIRFVVVQVQPGPAAYVSVDTEVLVREEPIKESELAIPRVTWEDIGDLEEAKQKIRELVELPLRHPELFKHLGIEPPKGILLYGPPGTGKSLLAEATAGEYGVDFIRLSLEDLEDAKEIEGPAVVLIDGLEKLRDVEALRAFFARLSGPVIVFGESREEPEPRLLRPGLFAVAVRIDAPNLKARAEILRVLLRGLRYAGSLERVAEATEGLSGADLARSVSLATMRALSRALAEGKDIKEFIITEDDLIYVINRYIKNK